MAQGFERHKWNPRSNGRRIHTVHVKHTSPSMSAQPTALTVRLRVLLMILQVVHLVSPCRVPAAHRTRSRPWRFEVFAGTGPGYPQWVTSLTPSLSSSSSSWRVALRHRPSPWHCRMPNWPPLGHASNSSRWSSLSSLSSSSKSEQPSLSQSLYRLEYHPFRPQGADIMDAVVLVIVVLVGIVAAVVVVIC